MMAASVGPAQPSARCLAALLALQAALATLTDGDLKPFPRHAAAPQGGHDWRMLQAAPHPAAAPPLDCPVVVDGQCASANATRAWPHSTGDAGAIFSTNGGSLDGRCSAQLLVAYYDSAGDGAGRKEFLVAQVHRNGTVVPAGAVVPVSVRSGHAAKVTMPAAQVAATLHYRLFVWKGMRYVDASGAPMGSLTGVGSPCGTVRNCNRLALAAKCYHHPLPDCYYM
jgi:hypothetical protein